MWFVGGIVGITVIGIGYIVWTSVFNFQYPIPLICYIALMAISMVLFATLWFLFPGKWRRNKEFRYRLKWLIFALTVN